MLLYLCDWLPPDFGAVGQCSVHLARERAQAGETVVLGGLSSTADSIEEFRYGDGRLTIIRHKIDAYEKQRLIRRLLWTVKANLLLLWRHRKQMRQADKILFTGSPPFLLHLIAPLNLLMRKHLIYRITDFHPECLMAGMQQVPLAVRLFHRLTVFWRKRIDEFEILGEDQRRRLLDIGIPNDRIVMRRDPAPIEISKDEKPLDRPAEIADKCILMYSGNYGVAHDADTFIAGYRRHHRQGTGRVALWLNAVGARAGYVEDALRAEGLPVHRTRPVPLELLPRLLMTPDAHLITLIDSFVGFVMPSKVFGCIQSGRDVLFVGSDQSDVDLLCKEGMAPGSYFRVSTGDAAGVADALEQLADRCDARRSSPAVAAQTH
jgi:hypothetical protein